MAARLYADIPRFKKIEARLRSAVRDITLALQEIEIALNAPRSSDADKAVLRRIGDQTRRVQHDSKQVLRQLYVEADK